MESIIIIAPHEYEDLLTARIPSQYKITQGSDGNTVIEDGQTRIYLTRDDEIRQDFEPARLAEIDATVPAAAFYTLDFTDIDFCRSVLIRLADDPRLLIDNDHGIIMPGPAFVRRLQAQTTWDWRDDPINDKPV